MTQRPELYGAALPAVGVLDMLRFHKFTIGWAWVDDYGSSDTAGEFPALLKYSPLHNLKAGTCYPPTLVTTADHDDRVVPAHSFKFAAALQEAQGCGNPVLIRIETQGRARRGEADGQDHRGGGRQVCIPGQVSGDGRADEVIDRRNPRPRRQGSEFGATHLPGG